MAQRSRTAEKSTGNGSGSHCAGVDSPTDATTTTHYQDDPIPLDHPAIHRADGRYQASVLPDQGRLYRVTVAGSGTSPVAGPRGATPHERRTGRTSECSASPTAASSFSRAQLQLTGSAQLTAAPMLFPIINRSRVNSSEWTKCASHSRL